MSKMLRRSTILSLAMFSVVMLSSCYGHFPLTRAVYRTNGNVGGQVEGDSTQKRLFQSIVQWIFIPVYGGAIIVDAAVLNVMEFWTHEVVQIGSARDGDTHYAFVPSADGRTATMTLSRDGKVLSATQLTRVSDSVMEMRDGQGRLTGTIHRDASGVRFVK